MDEGRLENIKESLAGLETLPLYDTHDFSIALSETGQIALELVEEVERLSAFETRMRTRLAEQRTMRVLVLLDLDAAWRAGREMMASNLSRHRDHLDVEIKVMRMLLEVED